MSVPYAIAADENDYALVMAASSAIENRVNQHAPLLSVETTYRTLLQEGGYISLPRPCTPTTVAILEPEAYTTVTTAADLVARGGARLVVDERTLSIHRSTQQRSETTAYRWESNRIWRLVSYGASGLWYGGWGYQNQPVWVDGIMGWGKRISDRVGWPSSLALDADSAAYTGAVAPGLGTALQWGRELMAVSAVSGSAGAWTVGLDRGLADTEQAEHAASTDLYRLDPKPNLRTATALLAKRYAQVDRQPGAGPAWDPEGDTTPSVWRNIDPLIREFVRPFEA